MYEVIKKVGNKYVLYPKKGGKRLGTHNTKKAARNQEKAVKASKYEHIVVEKTGCDCMYVSVYERVDENQEKIDKKIYYGEIPFLFLYIILPFSKLWSLLTKKRELINLGSIYTLKNQCLKISYELAKKELNHKPRSIHSTISDTLSWFDSEHDI